MNGTFDITDNDYIRSWLPTFVDIKLLPGFTFSSISNQAKSEYPLTVPVSGVAPLVTYDVNVRSQTWLLQTSLNEFNRETSLVVDSSAERLLYDRSKITNKQSKTVSETTTTFGLLLIYEPNKLPPTTFVNPQQAQGAWCNG